MKKLLVSIIISTTTIQSFYSQDLTASRLSDINPGSENSNIEYLTHFGEYVYFGAYNENLGSGIWRIHTVTDSVSLVKIINPTTAISNMTIGGRIRNRQFPILNNEFIFPADDGIHGLELWKSDGTAEGTGMIMDINEFGDGAPSQWDKIIHMDSFLIFSANEREEEFASENKELWRTDGTVNGTYKIKEINTNTGIFEYVSAHIRDLELYDDIVYFSANDETGSSDLWRSNGTDTGTYKLTSGDLTPTNITKLGDIILFHGRTDSAGGELYKYDLQNKTTEMVKNIFPGNNWGCRGNFKKMKSKVYFSGNDGEHGYELWVSDGTELGTHGVKDIYPGFDSGLDIGLNGITISNDSFLIFLANDGIHGEELWITEGTSETTELLKDIHPFGDCGAFQFTECNNRLYFAARNSNSYAEPWSSDGTSEGTKLLADISNFGNTYPNFFTTVDTSVYFCATNDDFGEELWKVYEIKEDIAKKFLFTGNNSWGSGFGDYDNDSLTDLYIANYLEPNFLFNNIGNDSLKKIDTGPQSTDDEHSWAINWTDIDNDGFLDIYVINGYGNNSLYKNFQDGSFVKVDTGIIVTDNTNSNSAAWADVDGNGFLDLFIANGSNSTSETRNENNTFYRNMGKGYFEKDLNILISVDGGFSQDASWVDYDNDNDQDLLVLNTFGDNFFYENVDGDFKRILSSPLVSTGEQPNSAVWGDYNNDEKMDVIISSYSNTILYRNNGDNSWTNKVLYGVSGNIVESIWADLNNDKYLDIIFIRTGQSPLFFKNKAGFSFELAEYGELTTTVLDYATSASVGDINNDGSLDLFIPNNDDTCFLFLNNTNRNWLKVKLDGQYSNKLGVGSKIRIKSKNVWQKREVEISAGKRSNHDIIVHFGLDFDSHVDSLIVNWPSGIEQVLTDIEINQMLEITEDTLCFRGHYTDTTKITICEKDSSLIRGEYQKIAGFYIDSLLRNSGCDSIVVTELVVLNTKYSTTKMMSCEPCTSPSGKYAWSESGTYSDTLPSSLGCDSIIVTELTIRDNLRSSNDIISCGAYTSPSGLYTWNETGTYYDTISSSLGCDSILEIDLSVIIIDTSIGVVGNVFTATPGYESYQWLNCQNNYSHISGENSNSFNAVGYGIYAVEINESVCVDTSSCHRLSLANLFTNNRNVGFSLFPNPTNGLVSILSDEILDYAIVLVKNINGQVLAKEEYYYKNTLDLVIPGSEGVYIIELKLTNDSVINFMVLKEK